ncbi:hypothetical protein PR001_g31592, partial [Phytophthora rubi]
MSRASAPTHPSPAPPRPRASNLSDDQRVRVVAALLHEATGGVVPRGAVRAVAEAFGVHARTVSRVWRRAVSNFDRNGSYASPSQMHRAGRPRADRARELERLRGVDPQQRSTTRSAAQACFLPPTTLFRELRLGKLCVATSVAKPTLTEENKMKRISFSLDHVDPMTHLFDEMEDVVHVDEKLFYLSKVKRRCVLLPDEPKPVIRLKSKRHIPKVMVLVAVARPRHDPVTGEFFDGKLGTWAFLKHEPAERSSCNRPAGTMVPCPVTVNKTSYREMLTELVLPSIRAKFPGAASGRRITVQQDNASPHIQPDDTEWCQAVEASGCNVKLRF